MTESESNATDKNNPVFSLEELIDIKAFQDLSESFSKLTGIATAILTLDGKVLTASGWQRICEDFHRKNPESLILCHESDTTLANQLAQGNLYNLYKCKHGLIDVAVPIIVDKTHIGNVFIGQFLFQAPDRKVFEDQAEKYGYNRQEYLKALEEVPILTSEKARQATNFLSHLTKIIAIAGIDKKKILDLNRNLEKLVQERTAKLEEENTFIEALINSLPGIFYVFNRFGKHIRWNRNFETVTGYSTSQVTELSPMDLFADPEDKKKAHAAIEEVFNNGNGSLEAKFTTRSGKQIPYYFTGYKFTLKDIDYLVGVGLDISERTQIEKEKEILIQQLQETLSKVKQLSGFLPICASCKKIRDDTGYWNQIEEYIRDHSEAEFSHSLCPNCVKDFFPDYPSPKNK